MTVYLSPVGGAGAQFFSNNGVPLSGGKIYTYAAGTTTPQATYTTSAGNAFHTNPIVLDAAGRVPNGGEIWLLGNVSYKFVLKTSTDVLIATYDNLIGINSNFFDFINDQEVQVATAGQTVFTLTTMQYQPGTNSLSVFVDGVNQYGPGALYAYEETDSTTVTFTAGLHVGAQVKFSTTQLQNVGTNLDASQIAYDPPFTGSVATNVEAKLAQTVSVMDFGAVGDGVTDDTAAIQATIDSLTDGQTLYIPQGNYLILSTIQIVDKNINIECEGTIFLTSEAASYIKFAQTDTISVSGTTFASLPVAGDLTLSWASQPSLIYPSNYFFTFTSSEVEIVRLGYGPSDVYTKNETNAIVDPENWRLRNPVELTYTIANDLTVYFYERRRPVTVRGLKIKVLSAGGPVTKSRVLFLAAISNVTFENCEIYRQESNWTGSNIRMEDCWDLTFKNCEVRAQNSTAGDSYAFDNYNSAQITFDRCKYVDGNGFPTKQERGYAARHGGYISFYDCQFAGIDDHYGHNYFIENCNFTKANSGVTFAGGSLTIKDCKYGASGTLFAQRADTPYNKGQLTIDNCTSNGQLLYSGRDSDSQATKRRLFDSIRIVNCSVNNSSTNSVIQVGGWVSQDTKSPVNAFLIDNIYFVRENNTNSCAFIDAYQSTAYRWVTQMLINNCRFALANYSAGLNKNYYTIYGLTASWLRVNGCTGFYFQNIDIDRVDVFNTSNYVAQDTFDQTVVGTTGQVTFDSCDLNGTINTNGCSTATYIFRNCNFTNGYQWASSYPPVTNMAAQTIYLSRNITGSTFDISFAPGGSIQYYINSTVLKD